MGKRSVKDKWTKHQRKRLAPNTLIVTHTRVQEQASEKVIN